MSTNHKHFVGSEKRPEPVSNRGPSAYQPNALPLSQTAKLTCLLTTGLAVVVKARELCESRGGRPGLPVPNSPYGLCGRKARLNYPLVRAQELCESRGGRPALLVPNCP